ncbi:MAG: hypothetical protein QXK86_03305 [Candidatus Bathyarchaeia archaeon]
MNRHEIARTVKLLKVIMPEAIKGEYEPRLKPLKSQKQPRRR